MSESTGATGPFGKVLPFPFTPTRGPSRTFNRAPPTPHPPPNPARDYDRRPQVGTEAGLGDFGDGSGKSKQELRSPTTDYRKEGFENLVLSNTQADVGDAGSPEGRSVDSSGGGGGRARPQRRTWP